MNVTSPHADALPQVPFPVVGVAETPLPLAEDLLPDLQITHTARPVDIGETPRLCLTLEVVWREKGVSLRCGGRR